MAYSGKFKPKNTDKYAGDWTNIVYRSMWEKHCFKWCDENPLIEKWSSEETIVPYFYDVDKKYHRYFVDLKFTMGGKTFLIEIKPAKETEPPKKPDRSRRYISESLTYVKNMNKWKAANKFAEERGWSFQIWTEDTLKQMGIMTKDLPKTIKPLKKVKPLRVKKKKT